MRSSFSTEISSMNPDGPNGLPSPSYKSALNARLIQTSTNEPSSERESVTEKEGSSKLEVTQLTSSVVPAEGNPLSM